MSGANSEQKLAIEHNGGVLLQAGAGSGKTFVLIEHIFYILNNCLYRNDGQLITSDHLQLRENLKNKLSKIVLMTFTKKAAGELSIRLSGKIAKAIKQHDESERADEFNPWPIVKECIDYLTVSTIDGFCFKLLKEGYLPEFTPNLNIIMDAEFRNKIQVIFNEWLEKNAASYSSQIEELLVFHRDNVLNSIYKIFSNPELRILWKDLKEEEFEEFNIETTMEKIFIFEGYKDFLDNIPYHAEYPDYSKQAWCKFLEGFDEAARGDDSLFNKVKNVSNYLSNFKRTPTQPKVDLGLTEVNEFFEVLKQFKKFISSFYDDLNAYHENLESIVKPWMKAIKDLVKFIDANYLSVPGITFADLEYYVLLGVRDKTISNRILKNYDYFIIDEFQDTSFVQFEIIEQIINNDFSKIFCVGDIKQAIYGFKGGEIKVFKDCENRVPLNLQLSNNYRSKPNIIKLNNLLFDYTFNLGIGFDNVDFDPVKVVHQTVPENVDYQSQGKIFKLLTTLKSNNDKPLKLNSATINSMEAKRIYDDLIEKVKKEEYDNYAVLYRKLGPSISLINLLIEGGNGFSAQIKIPFSEDPIIGIFRTLIEFLYDTNRKKMIKHDREELEFVNFMLSSYLNILNIQVDNLENKIKSFYKDIKVFGLFNSFEKLLFSFGISNSNQNNNLNKIKSICGLAQTYDQIISLLDSSREDKYSLEFQAGTNSRKIVLMTAHASKGLQFDHVYLGGIHTNGRENPSKDTIGKLPGSFKWYLNIESRDAIKTPMFIYENIFTKHKNFSESKRLFYVACTRAETAIAWVDFIYENTTFSVNKNSWIKGINEWEGSNYQNSIELYRVIDENKGSLEINCDSSDQNEGIDSENIEEDKTLLPLFHQDNVGLTGKRSTDDFLLILPELSVTKASIITQCPRKFYFKNICKIEEEDIRNLNLPYVEFELEKESERVEDNNDGELQFEIGNSSASRGTNLHNAMEYAVNHNFVIPNWDSLSSRDVDGLSWCIEILKEQKYQKLIAEKMIKFSLFGHMISGTPDLVLLDHSRKNFAVWDYKSGKRKPSTEEGYWFQLHCYAYALYELNMIEKSDSISLQLLYLDEQQTVDRKVSYPTTFEFIKKYWSDVNKPYQINQNHCSSCTYNNICQI